MANKKTLLAVVLVVVLAFSMVIIGCGSGGGGGGGQGATEKTFNIPGIINRVGQEAVLYLYAMEDVEDDGNFVEVQKAWGAGRIINGSDVSFPLLNEAESTRRFTGTGYFIVELWLGDVNAWLAHVAKLFAGEIDMGDLEDLIDDWIDPAKGDKEIPSNEWDDIITFLEGVVGDFLDAYEDPENKFDGTIDIRRYVGSRNIEGMAIDGTGAPVFPRVPVTNATTSLRYRYFASMFDLQDVEEFEEWYDDWFERTVSNAIIAAILAQIEADNDD
jgi:hypothetical protein